MTLRSLLTPRIALVTLGALTALAVALGAAAVPGRPLLAQSPNLIANPDLETEGAGGLPEGWIRGRWGVNTAVFEYPSPGDGASRGAAVTLVDRTSGDAKWAFAHVAVAGGKTYEFSNIYRADMPTFLTVEYRHADGRFSYVDIANPPARSAFTAQSVRFATPLDAVSLTVFHLINRPGTLAVDSYRLIEIAPAPPSADNLVPNPSLEIADVAGRPASWATGHWGTNTANFVYPVPGFAGARAARVEMTSYASGDAKWYFAHIPASPGVAYLLEDRYRSNAPSAVTVEVRRTSGTLLYLPLATLPASGGAWNSWSGSFTAPPDAASFTVFHVIRSVGYLEVDEYAARSVNEDPSRFAEGMVSLAFDDGWRSIYDNALPIVEARGFRSTQYVVTGRFGFPAYMTAEEVRDMAARGHETAAHTRTHRDLTTLSASEARMEIEGSRDDLRALGVGEVESFAYPFGAFNASVIDLVRAAGYSSARATGNGTNLRTADHYLLKRNAVKDSVATTTITSWIDGALAERAWLILVFHEVNASGRPEATRPEKLEAIVAYLAAKGARVVTVSEGRALLAP